MKTARTNSASVLLISHSYPPVLGGSELEAQRLSSELIRRGHCVRVVCAGGEPMPAVRDWVDPKGIPVRIYAGRWKGAMKDIVFALRVAGMLIRERHNYQIVYFLMQGLHVAAGLPTARLLRKPIIMKISGSGIVPLMSRSFFGRLELRWLRRWAQYVIVLNEGMRQEAIDHGLRPEQLLWMPNPIDTDEFAPIAETDRCALRMQRGFCPAAPVVLYCGRLAPEKGLAWLLEAFSLVLRQAPTAKLVLVGDGESRIKLERSARRLNMEKDIRFVGAVDPAQVASWLNIADVFTLLSPAEGFPNAVAEAMATGLACIVSDIPANRQLIRTGEEGILIPVGNTTAIAGAIVRLISDRPLRFRIGYTARKCIVENFATQRVGAGYEELLEVVSGRKTCFLKQARQCGQETPGLRRIRSLPFREISGPSVSKTIKREDGSPL